MSDRHRHEEFIRALIFSLVINLLFVFAFLAQCQTDKSPDLQPLVVSLTAKHRPLPSSAIFVPSASATPAKTKKPTALPPIVQPLQANVASTLAPEDKRAAATVSTVTDGELAGEESAATARGEGIAATPAQETTDSMSIFADKMAGEHYTAPEYLVGEKPPYPTRAARNGWEGTVLLTLSINAKGEVERVGIARSSGYELLDQQARKSVGTWRFNPARRNGIAMAVTVQQPIIFRPAPKNTP